MAECVGDECIAQGNHAQQEDDYEVFTLPSELESRRSAAGSSRWHGEGPPLPPLNRLGHEAVPWRFAAAWRPTMQCRVATVSERLRTNSNARQRTDGI